MQKILVMAVILGAVYAAVTYKASENNPYAVNVPVSYVSSEYNPYADEIPKAEENKLVPPPTPKAEENKTAPAQKKKSVSTKKSVVKKLNTKKNVTRRTTSKSASAQQKVKTPAQNNVNITDIEKNYKRLLQKYGLN